MISIPKNNKEQTLVYKQVGENPNEIVFFPPLQQKYEKAPLLFLIPGGGWQRNTAISMYNMAKPTAESLRQEGFAVATISYRGQLADGVHMPQIVGDVYDALGYLSRYSQVLGIDPHKVYAMGHSAGAHLSLMVGYDTQKQEFDRLYPETFTVKGVVAISPVTFFPEQNLRAYTPLDITDIFEQWIQVELDRFSPLCLVTANVPPTYIATGEKDELIYCSQSEMLYQTLTRLGVKTKFTLCLGGDHSCLPAKDEESCVPDLWVVLEEVTEFILSLEK